MDLGRGEMYPSSSRTASGLSPAARSAVSWSECICSCIRLTVRRSCSGVCVVEITISPYCCWCSRVRMSRCIALTGSALSDRSTPDGTNVDRIPNAIAGPLLHRVQVDPPVRERALAQVFAAGRPVGEVQLQQTHPPELQRQPGKVDPVLELRVPHPLRSGVRPRPLVLVPSGEPSRKSWTCGKLPQHGQAPHYAARTPRHRSASAVAEHRDCRYM